MLVGALPKRALSLLEVASAPAEAREVSNNNDVSGGVLVMVDNNWDEHMTADGARACKGFLRVTSKIDGEILHVLGLASRQISQIAPQPLNSLATAG